MTQVVVPQLWREHTGGVTRVQVEATTVDGLIAELIDRFPQLERWLDNGHGAVPDYTHIVVGDIDVRTLADGERNVPSGCTVRIVVEMAGGST